MNTVGVGNILIKKLYGTPLDWQGAIITQREQVIRQLTDIMLEIKRHPFDRLGLLMATSAISGGEMASAAAEPQIKVQGLAQYSTFRSGEDDRS